MRNNLIGLICVLLLSCAPVMVSGAEDSIAGRVIDAETREPIEGAIVLMVWQRTVGLPGLTSTDTYKQKEVLTGKDGRFAVSKEGSRSRYPRIMVIAKRGYTAWRNDEDFLTGRRKRIVWTDNLGVIEMEKWKDEYSHRIHASFIRTGTSTIGARTLPKFSRFLQEERIKSRKEKKY